MNTKQRVFVEEYLTCWNASEAARRAGYKHPRQVGSRLLSKVDIQEAIRKRIDEKVMSADEVLIHLSEQAHADLGMFYKVVEEWTFYPLPTYDIIDAKEVVDETDPDNPVNRVSYWVRHVAIDTDRLVDPRYSHLLHKFTDSPKNGLGIEIYSKQQALKILAQHHGLLVDRTDLTSGGEAVRFIEVIKS